MKKKNLKISSDAVKDTKDNRVQYWSVMQNHYSPFDQSRDQINKGKWPNHLDQQTFNLCDFKIDEIFWLKILKSWIDEKKPEFPTCLTECAAAKCHTNMMSILFRTWFFVASFSYLNSFRAFIRWHLGSLII